MRKGKRTFWLFVIIALISGPGKYTTGLKAQERVCLNDTVLVYAGDYRGDIKWQRSGNGRDWAYMEGYDSDTVSLIAIEPFFIRMEVTEGTCKPLFSETISVELHDPPQLDLNIRDSACISERDFLLEGGYPEGGEYFGTGVSGGRFDPASAGPGLHEIGYYYSDPETTCRDTIFDILEVFPLTSEANAGEDISLIMSDSIQLQADVPEYGTGSWSVVTGEGGVFSDPTDPNSWFRKDSAQLNYELRWTVEGPCGTNSDEVSLGFMELGINPCPDAPVVIDQDGNIYKTVQIGDQCWMAENLRTGVFVESTVSSSVHSDLADNGVIEKYCFENDTANCTQYGGLYDWHEAMGYSEDEGVQGICPEGWHLPTNEDWGILDDQYKYGNAGEFLKETGDSGFGGQFAGDRHQRGEFYSFGSSGFFWSSTSYIYMNYNEGYFRKICACNGALEEGHFNKITGLSVRCVKDNN